jgi:tripartite-type tricarboxylate transporter receptor subunit TctC
MGVDIVHVPYRGAGNAMQDLLGGRIDYMCDTIQTGVEQVKSGTVKGIAVMAHQRVPIIADLATTGEQGLAEVEATVWNAFFFPKGTPELIVRRMNKALGDMVERPDIRQRLRTSVSRSCRHSRDASVSRRIIAKGDRALARCDQGGRHKRQLVLPRLTSPLLGGDQV